MKLSDAIRLGAMLRPCKSARILTEDGSCSLGAAIEAAGLDYGPSSNGYEMVVHHWPWTNRRMTPEQYPQSLSQIERKTFCDNDYQAVHAISLMTIHWKSRERVADWVASIEPQEEPRPAEPLGEPRHHESARSCTL